MKRISLLLALSVPFLGILNPLPAQAAALYSFSSHTFTSCGATGQNGPTLASCKAEYATSWANNSSYYGNSSGIQTWVAPLTGSYQVTAAGAVGAGGQSTKGLGAIIRATVTLTQGNTYKILVGQAGLNGNYNSSGTSGGGGGGTFFTDNSNSPIVIAGGGGGTHNATNNYQSTSNGQTTTSGATSSDGTGSGGTSGGGGSGSTSGWGGGGGGLTSSGTSSSSCTNSGGTSFVGGGLGATSCTSYNAHGGFGGGGSTHGWSGGGAGGGGYSGGGGGNGSNSNAGGGGSYVIAGATNIATSNGTYAGSSTGITNLSQYNGTSGSSTFAAGYLTIELLLSPVTVSISSGNGSSTAYFRTVFQIVATISTAGGKVTFYANGKVIPSCLKLYTATTTVTCNWKPSIKTPTLITVSAIPNNGATFIRGSGTQFLVAKRSTNR